MSLRAILLTVAIQLAALLAPIAAGLAGLISGAIAGLASILVWFIVGMPLAYAVLDARDPRPAVRGLRGHDQPLSPDARTGVATVA